MSDISEHDASDAGTACRVKVICLGDSAVGKSNQSNQLSTYALNIHKHQMTLEDRLIDVDIEVTNKVFNFTKKNNIPFYFVSAANGTNVVRVFTDAVRAAVAYKDNSADALDQIMQELEVMDQKHEMNDSDSYADPLS